MEIVGHDQVVMLRRHAGAIWCIYMEIAIADRRKIVQIMNQTDMQNAPKTF